MEFDISQHIQSLQNNQFQAQDEYDSIMDTYYYAFLIARSYDISKTNEALQQINTQNKLISEGASTLGKKIIEYDKDINKQDIKLLKQKEIPNQQGNQKELQQEEKIIQNFEEKGPESFIVSEGVPSQRNNQKKQESFEYQFEYPQNTDFQQKQADQQVKVIQANSQNNPQFSKKYQQHEQKIQQSNPHQFQQKQEIKYIEHKQFEQTQVEQQNNPQLKREQYNNEKPQWPNQQNNPYYFQKEEQQFLQDQRIQQNQQNNPNVYQKQEQQQYFEQPQFQKAQLKQTNNLQFQRKQEQKEQFIEQQSQQDYQRLQNNPQSLQNQEQQQFSHPQTQQTKQKQPKYFLEHQQFQAQKLTQQYNQQESDFQSQPRVQQRQPIGQQQQPIVYQQQLKVQQQQPIVQQQQPIVQQQQPMVQQRQPINNQQQPIAQEQQQMFVGNQNKSLLQYAQDQRLKQCKQCSVWIDLDFGCNHVKCRCGHEFCFNCGKDWVGQECRCLGIEEMIPEPVVVVEQNPKKKKKLREKIHREIDRGVKKVFKFLNGK